MFQGDIPDFFYRLRTPQVVWPFMVLPGISAEEFRAYAAARGVSVTIPHGARFVCLIVLTMGWNWAPYLAHTSLEELLESISEEWQVGARARDRFPAPSLVYNDLVHWAFMDDYVGALLRLEGSTGEEEMKDECAWPDVATYNAAMGACEKGRQWKGALNGGIGFGCLN